MVEKVKEPEVEVMPTAVETERPTPTEAPTPKAKKKTIQKKFSKFMKGKKK